MSDQAKAAILAALIAAISGVLIALINKWPMGPTTSASNTAPAAQSPPVQPVATPAGSTGAPATGQAAVPKPKNAPSSGPASAASPNPGSAEPAAVSHTCRYDAGPKAGFIEDFRDVPGVIPVNGAGPCSDGAGSTGHAIPDGSAGPTSSRCRFVMGSLQGQIVDYAPHPKLPIGTPCNNGTDSTGQVVP